MVTHDYGFLIPCNETKENKTEVEEEDCRRKRHDTPKAVEKMYPRYGRCPEGCMNSSFVPRQTSAF